MQRNQILHMESNWLEEHTWKRKEKSFGNELPSPIQPNKEATDREYDLALDYILENINYLSLVAGTHNEKSSQKLALALDKYELTKDDSNIFCTITRDE